MNRESEQEAATSSGAAPHGCPQTTATQPEDRNAAGNGGRAGKKSSKPIDKRLTALKRFAISITVFNLLGHTLLGFETSWAAVAVSLATGYTLELAFETLDARLSHRRPRYAGGPRAFTVFLLPIHIGALAISMLLYPGDQLWPFVFAVSVTVGAKHVVQAPVNGKMRHTLNPSNAGLAATLLLFPWVGVGLPYQFTEYVHGWLDWVIPLGIFASGIMLNWKLTNRMPLIIGWVAGFALQAFIRGLSPDVSMVGGFATMTGLAFLLFTTYMITDPGTTPSSTPAQVAFGAASAGLYGLLMYLNIAYGLFYGLVIVCAVRTAYLWVRHLVGAPGGPAESRTSAQTRPGAATQPAVASVSRT